MGDTLLGGFVSSMTSEIDSVGRLLMLLLIAGWDGVMQHSDAVAEVESSEAGGDAAIEELA